MQIYRAKENEDVYSIAGEFGVSPIKLSEHNDLSVKGNLPVGREMLIIVPTRTYNVKGGDTLDKISLKFGVKKEDILRMNPELSGREKLYPGQLLTVRSAPASYGMINTNGYFYRGCSMDRLVSVIPYLGYVTLCSAVYKGGAIHSLFPTEDAVLLTKSLGRVPMLRIYLTEFPGEDDVRSLADSAVILAKAGGFAGVTLSGIGALGKMGAETDSLVFTMRRELMRSDLLLFVEGDCEAYTSYMEYADAGILTYDKIHKNSIPCFDDGERASFERFSENHESSRTFVEISSFACSAGKYIEKSEAMRITDRKRGEIDSDDDKKIIRAVYGKKRKHEIIYESLENTKSKLELVSELGYLGVAFDIGRVCTADLMMMSEMFGIITHPILFG